MLINDNFLLQSKWEFCLQEMLLAHSKTTAHCEPITVILAEVEAPELSALLGFVYTGSATVPRARLDAFLRAAEALHIRLPPVPVVMTSSSEQMTNCKLEDVKDIKVNPKYLQCDQYPWYQSGRKVYEDLLDRKESCILSTEDDRRDVSGHVGASSHEVGNSDRIPFDSGCRNTWPINHYQDRAIDDSSAEKDRGSMIFADRNSAPVPDSESSFSAYQQSARISGRPHLDEYGGSDQTLERIRMGYERLRVNNTVDRPVDEDVFAGGSVGESRGGLRDECPYQDRIPAPSSLQCVGRTRSFDYTSQLVTGEDLSCGESCCRWRTARRHVANRVTASPWRQIVRPHHSPRTPRPVVMPPCHADDVSIKL